MSLGPIQIVFITFSMIIGSKIIKAYVRGARIYHPGFEATLANIKLL